jgi:hypothetical protein
MSYMRIFLRFWWLLVLGAGLGTLLAIASVEHISLSAPPKLTPRAKPTYSATSQLLVNSTADPYLRTGLTQVVPRPGKIVRTGSTGKSGSASGTTTTSAPISIPQAPDVSTQIPDTRPLVQAANFFPLLIESNQVAKLREQLYGPLPGAVSAQALFSSSTGVRFRPSTLPVIVISASSNTPRRAIRLAQATTVAFERWLIAKQAAANVPRTQRILLDQLQVPTGAASSGGTKYGLPMFLTLAILAAFAALAVLLDRLLPARRRVDEPASRPSYAQREVAEETQPRVEAVRQAAGGEGTF